MIDEMLQAESLALAIVAMTKGPKRRQTTAKIRRMRVALAALCDDAEIEILLVQEAWATLADVPVGLRRALRLGRRMRPATVAQGANGFGDGIVPMNELHA